MWELNPRLSVHDADTLPTELTYLPRWVQTYDLQNYTQNALPTELLAGLSART